jgi:acyl-coenzyme A thioesterase 9
MYSSPLISPMRPSCRIECGVLGHSRHDCTFPSPDAGDSPVTLESSEGSCLAFAAARSLYSEGTMPQEETPLQPAQTSVVRHLRFSSDAALRRRFMLTDESVRSNLRAGLMLEVLDKLAEDTALEYVRHWYPEARVVTAAMDSMRVRSDPDETRDMVLRARVNLVGRTSMEVGVRIEQPDCAVPHIASSYFTMVARMRGPEGEEQSVPLPPLRCDDPLDCARADRARARREAYRQHLSAAEEPPSRDEFNLLRRLHEAQEQPGFAGVLAGKLVAEGWERTYPEQENVPQTVFGGYVAHRALVYAHICSEMIATDRALIVSVDRINFYQPVRMGDKLHFVSRVTYTGQTSIAVETSITRISRDRSSTALSNVCTFTFANVDADLGRQPVPQIYPTTYAEDARYLAAYRRRKAYLEQNGLKSPRVADETDGFRIAPAKFAGEWRDGADAD